MISVNECLRSLQCLVVLYAVAAPNALAFKVEPHRRINEIAAQTALGFDSYLRQDLALSQGIGTVVLGRSVQRWIGAGGVAEDDGFRSLAHFHTPLLPWDQSGLLGYDSAVRWAQKHPQDALYQASWKHARDLFWSGLTKQDRVGRDLDMAQTFAVLGNQMHLLADMAQPAHTRNDAHPISSYLGDFESFVDAARVEQVATSNLVTFAAGFDKATGDAVATVPVARLWDTNLYTGSNPRKTDSPLVGLAEFTSANFFSEDTMPCGAAISYLPYPQVSSLRAGPIEDGRPYLTKFKDGILIAHAAGEGVYYRFTSTPGCAMVLDPIVFQEYAALLIGRAVGYAADLLQYFFRARIDLAPNPADPFGYLIKNLGSEAMNGTFELYYDDGSGNRFAVPGAVWSASVAAGGQFPVTFSAPPTPSPAQYVLVFRGQVGLEADAVTGKIVNPCPVQVTLPALTDTGCWPAYFSSNFFPPGCVEPSEAGVSQRTTTEIYFDPTRYPPSYPGTSLGVIGAAFGDVKSECNMSLAKSLCPLEIHPICRTIHLRAPWQTIYTGWNGYEVFAKVVSADEDGSNRTWTYREAKDIWAPAGRTGALDVVHTPLPSHKLAYVEIEADASGANGQIIRFHDVKVTRER